MVNNTHSPQGATQPRGKCRGTVVACLLGLTVALTACGGPGETDLIESARRLLAQSDLKAAIIQAKSALQKNPQSGEARFLLGKALLAANDPVAATVELLKAREAKVADEQVLPELARAMLATGDETKLIAQFSGLRLQDSAAAADLYTSLATAHATQADRDKARAAIELALQATPMYAPAVVLQSRIKAAEGDFDGALVRIDELLAREPANDRAGVLKGEMLLQGKRDVEGALGSYRQVLAANPGSVAARVAVVNIGLLQNKPAEARADFDLLKKAAPRHPETLHLEAQFAFRDKDYKRARSITDEILKAYPDNVRVLELAGAAEYRMRGYLQAEALLAKALKLAPQQTLTRLLLAQTYLRLGEADKTIDALQPVLDTGKANGATLSLAGEAYLQLGDARRSEEAFRLALKAAPQDARVRTSAAMAQMAGGNNAGAISELEAVAAEDSGPRADLALVSARLRQNDFAGALKAIDGLEKKLPDQALPLQLRGRVLMLKKDIDGAAKSFQAAVAKDPAYFPPVASLAALDLLAKKPDEARKRFNTFILEQPKSWQARLALAELEARVGAPASTVMAAIREAIKANPDEPRARLALVARLIASGDGKAALVAAQDATAALPNNLEVMDALGRAELAAGDGQRAVSTFKKLASLQARNPVPELRLADAYVAVKDLKSAAASLRRAAELQPDNVTVKMATARLAMIEERPQDALKIARELQRRAPKDPMAFTMEAEIEAGRKNWDAALAAYRAALQLERSSATAAKLHTALLAAGKAADAERLAADWLKANPKDAAFRYFLGDVALTHKDLARAEAHYRAVLEVQPENAMAMNNVAWLLATQGKPGAVAMAEKANALLPDRAPLVDTLATALEAEDQLPRAIEAQKRAVTLDANDASLTLHLARLYIKTGDKLRARAELESIARLGDKYAGQAEVASLLKSL